MPHYRVGILYGSAERRLKILRDLRFDIYVVNHDGFGVVRNELGRRAGDIHVLCLDQAAVYRNARTKKFKGTQATDRRRRLSLRLVHDWHPDAAGAHGRLWTDQTDQPPSLPAQLHPLPRSPDDQGVQFQIGTTAGGQAPRGAPQLRHPGRQGPRRSSRTGRRRASPSPSRRPGSLQFICDVPRHAELGMAGFSSRLCSPSRLCRRAGLVRVSAGVYLTHRIGA